MCSGSNWDTNGILSDLFCFTACHTLDFDFTGHSCCLPSIIKESGMVQWLRVEACDREIRVQFPAPAVISDLDVVCHSS